MRRRRSVRTTGGHGRANRVALVVLTVLALLPWNGAAARGGDDDPAAQAEVWVFEKGEARRTVDVTGLPELVRQVLLQRMQADGYARVAAPAPGQDLEADARELVAHEGRFADRSPGPAAGRAGVQSRLLGAPVRLETVGEASWLRVLGAPDGTLAAAIGLVRGDRILALDRRAPTLEGLARLRGVERRSGQLTLRVMRRTDEPEDWSLTFTTGPAPHADEPR